VRIDITRLVGVLGELVALVGAGKTLAEELRPVVAQILELLQPSEALNEGDLNAICSNLIEDATRRKALADADVRA
jgi:hypothetical protein